jgi:hypothetical protein
MTWRVNHVCGRTFQVEGAARTKLLTWGPVWKDPQGGHVAGVEWVTKDDVSLQGLDRKPQMLGPGVSCVSSDSHSSVLGGRDPGQLGLGMLPTGSQQRQDPPRSPRLQSPCTFLPAPPPSHHPAPYASLGSSSMQSCPLALCGNRALLLHAPAMWHTSANAMGWISTGTVKGLWKSLSSSELEQVKDYYLGARHGVSTAPSINRGQGHAKDPSKGDFERDGCYSSLMCKPWSSIMPPP